jgi:hypothetical protein
VAPNLALAPFSGITVTTKVSSVPSGLHAVQTVKYYQSQSNGINPGDGCGVAVGSSAVSIELAYTGTLGSVAFTGHQHSPLPADKFQATYHDVVNQGTVSTLWDSLDDFVEPKILLASEGAHIYTSDFSSLRDAEGYPLFLRNPGSSWFSL